MEASKLFFVLLALGPAFCMEETQGLSQKAPVPAAHNLSPPLPTFASHPPPEAAIAAHKSAPSLIHHARSRRQWKGEAPSKTASRDSGGAADVRRPMQQPSRKFFKVIHTMRSGGSPDRGTLHGPGAMKDFRKKRPARHVRGSRPFHYAEESLDAGHRRFRRDGAKDSCIRHADSHGRHRKGLREKKATEKRYERPRGHKKKRHARISELKSNNRLPRAGLPESVHAAHSTPLNKSESSLSDKSSFIPIIRVRMTDTP